MADEDKPSRSRTLRENINTASALIGAVAALVGAVAGGVAVRVVAPKTETTTVEVPRGHQPSRRISGTSCSPAPGSRDSGYEPNDDLNEAYGPLEVGRLYEAKMETGDDQDWYAVCSSRQQTVTALITSTSNPSLACVMELSLHSADGSDLGGAVRPEEPNHVVQRSARANGPARYLVEVAGSGAEDCTYTLRVESDAPLSDTIPRG